MYFLGAGSRIVDIWNRTLMSFWVWLDNACAEGGGDDIIFGRVTWRCIHLDKNTDEGFEKE